MTEAEARDKFDQPMRCIGGPLDGQERICAGLHYYVSFGNPHHGFTYDVTRVGDELVLVFQEDSDATT